MPKVFNTFLELGYIYNVVDDLLIEHQLNCMKGEWGKAYSTLEILYKLRIQIMSDEEDFLIPKYESVLSKIPKGGAIKYFIREHILIRKYFDKFIREVSQKALDPENNNIHLVSLFENYHNLKDLLDHHDSRDRMFLFTQLDEFLDKKSQSEILNIIAQRQVSLRIQLEIN